MSIWRNPEELENLLCVPTTARILEGFGRKTLNFSLRQLLGHDGTLTLLELQQGLKNKEDMEDMKVGTALSPLSSGQRSNLLDLLTCH